MTKGQMDNAKRRALNFVCAIGAFILVAKIALSSHCDPVDGPMGHKFEFVASAMVLYLAIRAIAGV